MVFGKFVANISKKDLSRYILDYFIKTIYDYYDSKNEELIELDVTFAYYLKVVYHCAFNFRALLYNYGLDEWDYMIRPYFKLCNDKENSIRKIMASSFGDFTNILKEENVQRGLVFMFDKFY